MIPNYVIKFIKTNNTIIEYFVLEFCVGILGIKEKKVTTEMAHIFKQLLN
jgi:hypothetical protein